MMPVTTIWTCIQVGRLISGVPLLDHCALISDVFRDKYLVVAYKISYSYLRPGVGVSTISSFTMLVLLKLALLPT